MAKKLDNDATIHEQLLRIKNQNFLLGFMILGYAAKPPVSKIIDE